MNTNKMYGKNKQYQAQESGLRQVVELNLDNGKYLQEHVMYDYVLGRLGIAKDEFVSMVEGEKWTHFGLYLDGNNWQNGDNWLFGFFNQDKGTKTYLSLGALVEKNNSLKRKQSASIEDKFESNPDKLLPEWMRGY